MSNQGLQAFILYLPIADDVHQPRHSCISRRVCEIIPGLRNFLQVFSRTLIFVRPFEGVDFEHRVIVTHNESNMVSNHGEIRGLELTAERIGLSLATRGCDL